MKNIIKKIVTDRKGVIWLNGLFIAGVVIVIGLGIAGIYTASKQAEEREKFEAQTKAELDDIGRNAAGQVVAPAVADTVPCNDDPLICKLRADTKMSYGESPAEELQTPLQKKWPSFIDWINSQESSLETTNVDYWSYWFKSAWNGAKSLLLSASNGISNFWKRPPAPEPALDIESDISNFSNPPSPKPGFWCRNLNIWCPKVTAICPPEAVAEAQLKCQTIDPNSPEQETCRKEVFARMCSTTQYGGEGGVEYTCTPSISCINFCEYGGDLENCRTTNADCSVSLSTKGTRCLPKPAPTPTPPISDCGTITNAYWDAYNKASLECSAAFRAECGKYGCNSNSPNPANQALGACLLKLKELAADAPRC